MDLIFLFFVGSFLLTYLVIPKIIKVVKYKRLLDEPNTRSSHTNVTPTLGGVAFFCTIIIGLFFLQRWDENNVISALTTSLTVLFLVGLKDDLVAVSALAKALIQVLAICFLLSNDSLVISSLNGFLGVQELNYYFSYIFSGFCVFYLINSYNLIDGIDGLASSIGITILSIYSFVFYNTGNNFYFLFCIILISTLLAFLVYNFSEKKKIFMGDTGSMIIGFAIGFLTLKLLSLSEFSYSENLGILPENTIILIAAVLFIPFLDTLRVFLIRTLNKKSFFIADTNHIHHVFLNMGYNHKKVTGIMVMINLIFAAVIFVLSMYLNSLLLLISFAVMTIVFCLILFYLNVNSKNTPESLNKIQKSNFLNKFASSILNQF